MRFTPTHSTAEEIIKRAGYVHANRGWQKPLHNDPQSEEARRYLYSKFRVLPSGTVIAKGYRIKSHRFHAFIDGNEIDLHFDHEEGGKHITKRFVAIVAAEIRHFEELDAATAPALRR